MSFEIALETRGAEVRLLKTRSAQIGDARETQIKVALDEMLASAVFCKAQRMCRLMRFLVEMSLLGKEQELNEYAIGIAVFDRDSRSYFPGEDPVVRVQVGRLREKLNAYYAAPGCPPEWRFSIPLGTYKPVIRRIGKLECDSCQPQRLIMAPLICITPDSECSSFTLGLNEELSHRLFQLFGRHMVSYNATQTSDSALRAPVNCTENIRYLLEGSVRADCAQLRLALRLTDTKAGGIVWSELFDHEHDFSLPAQSSLARVIGNAMHRHLSEALL